MSSQFFEQLVLVKAVLSASAPIQQKFADVQPLLRDPDIEREFWNLLDDERWVAALRQVGVFDNPPPPESVEGGTRFPYWGASKYLARIASRAPAEVAAVFADMKTENASVIGDMLDAAIAMPVESATVLVPAVRRAAAAGRLWIHFKDASDLCVRLAKGGDVDSSLSLAEALFAPQVGSEKSSPSQRDDYWYKEGLREVAPILAALRPQIFLPMICGWLQTLVRSTKVTDHESGDDYSYIWRPAIEEHEQNHDYDLAGVVVGSVREAFEIAIRDGEIRLPGALELLGERPLTIFRRLSLHLLAEFGDQEPALVTRTILDRDLFDDPRFKHEYARLVGQQLPRLQNSDRHEWYRWVDEGPDMSGFDERIRQHLRREPTDADRRSRIEYWKFERLHWVRDALDGTRRQSYERLLAQYGTPEMADLNMRIRTGWGEQSPMTVEQLMSEAFEHAVEQVSSWKAPDGFGPSLGGLVSTFADYVSRDPEQFSMKAQALEGRPSAFVSAYLRQMTAAIKAGRAVALTAVLDLGDWVIHQPVDDRWQDARDAVSELIEVACQATVEKNRPKYGLAEFRVRFWSLVRTLYSGSSQSYILRDTSADDLRIRDYLDLGINSPRGKAVEAGFDLVRWVGLHLTAGGDEEGVPGGIQAVPELAELIEWQIDPQNRSLEGMAIIGSRVGVINWIDGPWLASNAGRIFDLELIESAPTMAYGWAAWNAFLSWVHPHIVFYRAFENQFRYAVLQAGLVEIDKQDHDQPMFRLGEHLMVLYGRGQLPLTASVLQNFLNTAKAPIRRHAIGFVGSTFGTEEVPSEIVERFMALWDAYWAGHGRSDAGDDPRAVLFGSWFASGAFPDSWAVSALRDYVDVVAVPEPEHLVIERLAQIADVDIARAVQIVERMVKGDREGWRMHGWREPTKTILEQAVNAGGNVRSEAEEVIDLLGRRGYTQFGALLAT